MTIMLEDYDLTLFNISQVLFSLPADYRTETEDNALLLDSFAKLLTYAAQDMTYNVNKANAEDGDDHIFSALDTIADLRTSAAEAALDALHTLSTYALGDDTVADALLFSVTL